MSIAAVILAAGRSTRMAGENKLLAELGGKPLVRHVAEASLASTARPAIVVTGSRRSEIESALSGLDLAFAHNPDFADGLSTSLRVGIAAVPAGAQGAVILLGDMPLVGAALVDELLATFAASGGAAAVVPIRSGVRGNPVVLARRLFADIARLQGDEGARRLLAGRSDVVELLSEDPAIAIDIDTPEALAAVRG